MADIVDSVGKITVEKLTPQEARAKRTSTKVNGRDWHYIDAAPQGQQKGVIVLVHGFPDLSFGWRYQIPMLNELGLRVIALDCMGYPDTGASKDLQEYTFKSHATAIAAIAKAVGVDRIILGGHDWGGAAAWRIAQWQPELVAHVFVVCTPYFPVADTFVPTEMLVAGPLPQFGYQLQLGSEDQIIEGAVKGEERIRKFLKGVYGGKVSSGKRFMTGEKGVDLTVLEEDEVGMTPLLNEEELDFYVSEYTKNGGMNGPCNWYRTRKINFEEERDLPAAQRNGIQQPTLFITALRDSILKPEMAIGMEKAIPHLTRGEVDSSHWALWQTPKGTNEILRNWVQGVVFGGKSKI